MDVDGEKSGIFNGLLFMSVTKGSDPNKNRDQVDLNMVLSLLTLKLTLPTLQSVAWLQKEL